MTKNFKKLTNKKHRLSSDVDARLVDYVRQIGQEGGCDSRGNEALPHGLTTEAVYDYVQRMDFKFRRMKKLQLEQSINRVLKAIESNQSGTFGSSMNLVADNESLESNRPIENDNGQPSQLDDRIRELKDNNEDDEDSEFEQTEGVLMMEVKDTNSMNKSITRLWNQHGVMSIGARDIETFSPSNSPSNSLASFYHNSNSEGLIPNNGIISGRSNIHSFNAHLKTNDPSSSGVLKEPLVNHNSQLHLKSPQYVKVDEDVQSKQERIAQGSKLIMDTKIKRKQRLPSNLTEETGLGEMNRQTVGGKRAKTQQSTISIATAPSKSEMGFSKVSTSTVPLPAARLSDLGGVEGCIEEALELIAMPLAHPEIYLHTGIHPPRGILLHGPPGCGKTLLANAIAGELGVPFLSISAPSVVSGMSGESEKKIREVFEEARGMAPCLIFIDEIDAITPKRETVQREMERRIVAQLLTCMDDLSWEKTNNKPVLIIGATNRPDSLDPALRRAGRFDREISMGIPDEKGREKILKVMCSKLRLSGEFDFKSLAKLTPGYVGADLNALTAAAGVLAIKRIYQKLSKEMLSISLFEESISGLNDMQIDTEEKSLSKSLPRREFLQNQLHSPVDKGQFISAFLKSHPDPLTPEELEPLSITNDDFIQALGKVQPSSKREGFATGADVNWSDIGALSFVRDELRMAIVEPIKHPEYFQRVGITAPSGVLLWGPPGCGKTLLAKAVANENHTNFISVKGPELLNKYVGESERGVRQVFARARASSPCVIFFDELDALCPRRDESKSESSSRIVNTLLTELDGLENRKQVYVIGATNRPDIIDPAMLRPGRLDKLLYVELPTPSERYEILKTLTKKTPLAPDVDLKEIAENPLCEGFSGADLASLIREAAIAALRSTLYTSSGQDLSLISPSSYRFSDANKSTTDPESVTSCALSSNISSQSESQMLTEKAGSENQELLVNTNHFALAFTKVPPSVSKQDKRRYDRLRKKFGCVDG
ncbi:hypothetical protein G9A89_004755 [Geosiphon pyriformis]|nr:hypothetical protein G9A89_004755 [Geosiphon pyriformis]